MNVREMTMSDDTYDDLASLITIVMARAGIVSPACNLQRLSGGANMESWRFTCGDDAFVLRRAPSADLLQDRPLTIGGEVAVIRAATAAGVRAPEVVAELKQDDGIGEGFVMRCIAGTAEPSVLLSDPSPSLINDLARELAAIHGIESASLPALPHLSADEGLRQLSEQWESLGGDRPIIALGIAWLRANLPPSTTPSLCHGDFRIGNLMAENGKITGVLDWELAHSGDYHDDLAYGCMTVWRFGHIDMPAFGCADLATFFAAYEAAGGRTVDHDRFRFWLVYRTVWWALGCLNMGTFWRSGSDRSLERVVVARRAAEQELDLLLLLEADAPDCERDRPLLAPITSAPPSHGEPSARELLEAVSEWLQASIKPKLSGRDRFDLAVAQNALGIVRRELSGRPDPQDKDLSMEIMRRSVNIETPGVLANLRRRALDTIAGDQPKYPALKKARQKWGAS
jgi:aminoglycoside phosphotransferase (APT) family kinase protein